MGVWTASPPRLLANRHYYVSPTTPLALTTPLASWLRPALVSTGSHRPFPALALAGSLRYWWENTIDIIFIVDVFFNFRTGYIDKLNNMVTSPKLIARNYFRSWFTLDILRCDGLGVGCHSLNYSNFCPFCVFSW